MVRFPLAFAFPSFQPQKLESLNLNLQVQPYNDSGNHPAPGPGGIQGATDQKFIGQAQSPIGCWTKSVPHFLRPGPSFFTGQAFNSYPNSIYFLSPKYNSSPCFPMWYVSFKEPRTMFS